VNLFYNVTSSNNTFYFSQGGTNYTAQIANGYYDSSSIVSPLQTALNAAGSSGTYTVSVSSTTGFLNITNNTTAFVITNTNALNLSRTLGFGTVNPASATSQTAIAPIQIPSNVYFNIANQKKLYNPAKRSVLGVSIPLLNSFGNLIRFLPEVSYDQIIDFTTQQNFLQIQVTDDSNNPISMNGSEFTLILCKKY
jgi:hypothetical protein